MMYFFKLEHTIEGRFSDTNLERSFAPDTFQLFDPAKRFLHVQLGLSETDVE